MIRLFYFFCLRFFSFFLCHSPRLFQLHEIYFLSFYCQTTELFTYCHSLVFVSISTSFKPIKSNLYCNIKEQLKNAIKKHNCLFIEPYETWESQRVFVFSLSMLGETININDNKNNR